MLIHAIDIHQRIVVHADDTDVLVLLVYYYSNDQLSALVYMHACHSGQQMKNVSFKYMKYVTKLDPLCLKLCQPLMH